MTHFLRPIRILLIDDDEVAAELIEQLLRQGLAEPWELEWISDYQESRQAYLERRHDVALVDRNLGRDTGISLIREAREAGVITPAIILTGDAMGDDERNAISLGAADYLVKQTIDGAGLARSIRYAIERADRTDQLVKSEVRYRMLFDLHPEPLCVTDPESHRLMSFNAAASRLYGLKDDNCEIRMDDLLASSKQKEGLVITGALSRYRPSEGASLEVHRSLDGETLVVEVATHSIVLDEGPALLHMIVDVTDKLAALRKAHDNEEAYLRLLSDLSEATVVVDYQGRIHFSNAAADKLLPTAARSGHTGCWQGLLREGLSTGEMEIAVNPSVWVEFQACPTTWRGRTMQLVTLRDVSAWKLAESQLLLFKRGLDHSGNGVCIVDAEAPGWPIVYVNSAFCSITGYEESEALGRNPSFLQGPHTEQVKIDRMRKALAARTDVRCVLRNYRKDGTPFWNDLYVAPLPDENGKIRHFIGVQDDVSSKKAIESRLAYTTSHDVVTGLPNRALFVDRLQHAASLARRKGRYLAVLLIDMDRFKPVNNSLGHLVGDQILIQVADRLCRVVTTDDTVGRLNADEFAVLIPALPHPESVLAFVERIQAELNKPYRVGAHSISLTASVGISTDDGSLEDSLELLNEADLAMVEAKKKGRGSFHWYTADLNSETAQRLLLRNQLEEALDKRQLLLHHHPIVDARSGRIVSSEALVRWLRPDGTMVPPLSFIGVAEETGQILKVGQFVLEQACRDVRLMHDHGFSDHTVSVNVSPVQLEQPDFVASVLRALEGAGLAPQFLQLELTESVMLRDADHAIAMMAELGEMGVQIAIDDFGTGFSSLGYLRRMPAHKLKIDQSFIRNITLSPEDVDIVVSVIDLAHKMGLEVVAEGVETQQHARFMRNQSCDQLQGFYFTRPLPLGAYLDFLRNFDPIAVKPSEHESSSETKRSLLIVDDDQNILRALNRVLRREKLNIYNAHSAEQGLQLLEEHNIQVVVSDERMPNMSGFEFLAVVSEKYPETLRIVLSGYPDIESKMAALDSGVVYRYASKPWDDDEFRALVRTAFDAHDKTMSAGASNVC